MTNRHILRQPLVLFSLLVVFAVTACSPKGYRMYGTEEPGEHDKSAPSQIEFYFAGLDSIQPYVHVYPTGVRTEAPNLDPREFCAPRDLVEFYSSLHESPVSPEAVLAFPDRPFEIVGEIEIDLARARSGLVHADESDVLGPNKKVYYTIRNADWRDAFSKLRKRASEMGADAVLEIFCGKGVNSFWFPPSFASSPMFGPGGQIVGNYSYSTQGGVGLRGWVLVGMAVRWTEETSGIVD